MSKITVLMGSARKGGNTDLLTEAFTRGAVKNNEVEIISIADFNIMPCTGCNYCRTNDAHSCAIKDDMTKVYSKLTDTDILVIASPVYFYGISARLKAIIDRLHNPIRKSFKIKKMALLAVGADNLPELFDAIITQYRLSLNFFHLEDRGQVLVRGVEAKGAIEGNKALNEAFELGLSIH